MNKKLLFTILGIIILISAAVGYVILSPNKSKVVDTVATTTEREKTPTTTQPSAATTETSEPGVYRDYAEDALLNAKGTKLLFFYAPWCPQCRAMETSIENDGIPNGVTVFKVDYDSNQKLRQKYGVTIQTTFVKVDDAGNKTASYVAYEEPVFSSVERELLR